MTASETNTLHPIAVLPLGAREQHGPHLPFETDTLIAEAVASRLKKRLGGDIPLNVLPVEPVGYSVEHMDFPGSRTLSFDEAVNRWIAKKSAAASNEPAASGRSAAHKSKLWFRKSNRRSTRFTCWRFLRRKSAKS